MDNQTPMIWRIIGIGIAVAAVAIIAAFLWPGEATAPIENSQATPTTVVAADDAAATMEPPAEPATAEEFFRQGEAFFRTQDWDQAIASYERALELDPSYDAAYTNLGSAQYRKGNLEEAITAYERALELAPTDADTHHNLGMVYLQRWLSSQPPDASNLDRALQQINEAIRLNPDLPAPHYGLGVIYQVQGNTSDAITAFERFLELDDGSDPIATQQAEQILQQLRSQ